MPRNVRIKRSPKASEISPLAHFDVHEMTDSIKRTMKWTNTEIAANIGARSMSGRKFLKLSETGLRTLSKDNDRVFQELEELQKKGIPSLISRIFRASDGRLTLIFPELSQIHNHDHRLPEDFSRPSTLGLQSPEDNYEAFDYDDDEVEVTPDIHATAADSEFAVPQDDLNLPDHSLQPDVTVDLVLENGPPLAPPLGQTAISDADADALSNGPHNDDLAISDISFPITLTATTQAGDSPHTHIADEAHIPEPQSILDINADEPQIHGLDARSVHLLRSQSAGGLDGDNTHLQNDSALSDPDLSTPSNRRFSLLPLVCEEDLDAATQHNFHTTLDPNILSEQDRSPINFVHTSPVTVPPSDSLNEFQLENVLEPPHLPASELAVTLSSLECSPLSLPPFLQIPNRGLFNPNSDRCFDVNEGLNQLCETPQSQEETPDDPPSSTVSLHSTPSAVLLSHPVNIQSAASSSSDKTVEGPHVESELSSTQSHSWPSTPASPEDRHDLNVDEVPQSEDDEKSNADTYILPINIIPLTPPGSPILEGLAHYMILHDSEAPGGVLRVDQDNISTSSQRDISAGERTLWPPSEAPRLGLLSSSRNGQPLRSCFSQQVSNPPESPRSDVDIAFRSDLPCAQNLSPVQIRDSYPEIPTSPFERIQSGLLRVIPSWFTLDRATMNTTTSPS